MPGRLSQPRKLIARARRMKLDDVKRFGSGVVLLTYLPAS
jgi:hypothetical protein